MSEYIMVGLFLLSMVCLTLLIFLICDYAERRAKAYRTRCREQRKEKEKRRDQRQARRVQKVADQAIADEIYYGIKEKERANADV